MANLIEIVKTFDESITKEDNETIINNIKSYHPILVMYLDNKYDIKKIINDLPDDFFKFDFDDVCVQYIMDIHKIHLNDILSFIKSDNMTTWITDRLNHIENEIDTLNEDEEVTNIIKTILEIYINNNDLHNINNIYKQFNCFAFEILYQIISESKVELLDTFIIMNFYNNKENGLEDEEIFDEAFCKYIMSADNSTAMIRIFHDYCSAYPDKMIFNIDTVFNCALVNGNEKCMHYALNYGANYSIQYNHTNPADIIDTLIYAIIGKNINCIKTICEIYLTKNINDDNWERYLLFSSAFGTVEILQYLISLKPHKIEQIEQLYNNILKYALFNINLDCIKYALNNGAIFNDEMEVFVNNYNKLYKRSSNFSIHHDSFDFRNVMCTLPDNYNDEYKKCIDFIKCGLE